MYFFIGRDILPGLVKAHTAQGVGRELLCVLRVVIGQPVAKLLEAPGVAAKLIRAVALAARVAVATGYAAGVSI